MKMADGRGPQRLMPHNGRCAGDGHGMFEHTVDLVVGSLNGLLRFRRTCKHCGSTQDFNTKGETE